MEQASKGDKSGCRSEIPRRPKSRLPLATQTIQSRDIKSNVEKVQVRERRRDYAIELALRDGGLV